MTEARDLIPPEVDVLEVVVGTGNQGFSTEKAIDRANKMWSGLAKVITLYEFAVFMWLQSGGQRMIDMGFNPQEASVYAAIDFVNFNMHFLPGATVFNLGSGIVAGIAAGVDFEGKYSSIVTRLATLSVPKLPRF